MTYHGQRNACALFGLADQCCTCLSNGCSHWLAAKDQATVDDGPRNANLLGINEKLRRTNFIFLKASKLGPKYTLALSGLLVWVQRGLRRVCSTEVVLTSPLLATHPLPASRFLEVDRPLSPQSSTQPLEPWVRRSPRSGRRLQKHLE